MFHSLNTAAINILHALPHPYTLFSLCSQWNKTFLQKSGTQKNMQLYFFAFKKKSNILPAVVTVVYLASQHIKKYLNSCIFQPKRTSYKSNRSHHSGEKNKLCSTKYPFFGIFTSSSSVCLCTELWKGRSGTCFRILVNKVQQSVYPEQPIFIPPVK